MEKMETKKGGIFYGWWMVAVCTLIMATMFSLMLSCLSLFVVPVTEDLGISRSAFSGISTIVSVLGMIISPIAGRTLARKNIRFLMAGSLAVSTLAYAGFSLATSAMHLYICAFIMGAVFSFVTTVPMSILITRWFVKSRSTAMSITFAGSSIGGMVLSPILTSLLGSIGWRMTFRVFGLGMLAVLVPLVLLVIRSSPEEKGLKPLGAAEAAAVGAGAPPAVGIPLVELRKKKSFWVFVIGLFIAILTMGSIYHMPAHAIGVGFSAEQAALFVSIYSLIAIIGKLLMGAVFDKLGVKAGILLGMVSMALTFVFLLVARSFPMLMGAALFYGLGSAHGTIFPATLTGKMFGSKYYGETFGLVNSFASLSMAVGNPLMAASYDLSGSYSIAWIGGIAAAVVSILLLLSSAAGSKKVLEDTVKSGVSPISHSVK